jgi:PTS system cellobiose-specific IIC component
MDRFQQFITEKILPVTEKIGQHRHLQAIRDGIIQVLPLILIGSFFLLLGQPPGTYLENLVKPILPTLLIPFRLTFGLISIYVVATISYSLAKSYKMEGISTSILASVIFFIAATPRTTLPNDCGGSILCLPKSDLGWNLPIKYFGAEGLFMAIITAVVVVEALRFLRARKLMIQLPPGVPDGVAKAFEAIIPSFLIITFFWVIRDFFRVDLPALVIALFSPIKMLGDSYFAVVVITLVDSIAWFAGIHPVAIISPFARPIWLSLLTENAEAMAVMGRGAILPHIAVDQFYSWFIFVGGSGGTIGLVILLFFTKSKFLRQLGKVCIVPGIFNINEPLLFGLPIVANPMLIIPFVLAPLTSGTIAYIAFYLNLVQRPFICSPWTLPAPLGAMFSTGGDWRAFVLSIVVIIVSGAIYYPFIRVYDRQMLAREKEEEANGKEPGTAIAPPGETQS